MTTEQGLSLAGLRPYDSSSSQGFPPASAFPVLDQHLKAINGNVVSEMKGLLEFRKSGTVTDQTFGPPRLPGRGYRGRHILELELNVTLSV